MYSVAFVLEQLLENRCFSFVSHSMGIGKTAIGMAAILCLRTMTKAHFARLNDHAGTSVEDALDVDADVSKYFQLGTLVPNCEYRFKQGF